MANNENLAEEMAILELHHQAYQPPSNTRQIAPHRYWYFWPVRRGPNDVVPRLLRRGEMPVDAATAVRLVFEVPSGLPMSKLNSCFDSFISL